MNLNININDVSETAFLTLYSHALDAQSKEPILSDLSSVKTVQFLNSALLGSKKVLHKKLLRGKIDKKAAVHIVIRARQYDKYIRDYIKVHPEAAIVNIGCGLDNRFERVDNGKIEFFDLDLPDIIDIKRQLFNESDRYCQISQSVLDFSWMDKISRKDVLFIAEGVFMYLQETEVKALFLEMYEKFPGSEIVCEVFNSMWLKDWWKKMMKIKLQRELDLGEDAMFHFGIKDSFEIETWKDGFKLLGDWSYFDSSEKKLGFMRLFRNVKFFRYTQWTIHYRLGSDAEES
ncbi:class I SAM-dependent methyltransferase [Bacteroidota bacterium]